MKYIVIELQTAWDGTVANIVTAYADRLEAERQYHLVLAAAAVSGLLCHAAVLMTSEGQVLESRHYNNLPEYA